MMTKAMMTDMASMGLKAEAAKAQDPLAKARALQAAGQLDARVAPMMSQMALKRTTMQQMQGDQNFDPARAVSMMGLKTYKKLPMMKLARLNELRALKKICSLPLIRPAKKIHLRMYASPYRIFKLKALTLPLIHDQEGQVNEFEQKKTLNDLIPTRFDDKDRITEKRAALRKIY